MATPKPLKGRIFISRAIIHCMCVCVFDGTSACPGKPISPKTSRKKQRENTEQMVAAIDLIADVDAQSNFFDNVICNMLIFMQKGKRVN